MRSIAGLIVVLFVITAAVFIASDITRWQPTQITPSEEDEIDLK